MPSKQKEQPEASSVTTATATAQLDADHQVTRWRASELERAGYSSDGAAKLAPWAYIDLHLAVDIMKQGCPEETALEILL